MSVLKLKSEEQIFGDMFARVLSELGINDVNPGSVLSMLLEAAAAEDFEQYMQIMSLLRNFNLDTTTGQDLENKAFEFGLTKIAAKKATGIISILRPASFTKVATTLYAGKPSPVKNDTTLFVNDASNVLFGTSGTLIIGRGTANEEEVTYSVAPTDNTNYWTFTVSPLSNNHGLDETIVLKQGTDVTISAGTLIVVPSTGTSSEINFTVDQDVVLKAGESQVDSVSITCTKAGSQGNIPIGAITGSTAFVSAPFSGARAQNDSKFTTGLDQESDDALRDRIKNAIQSLSKGVRSAILNGIVGLVDPTTAKRIVSASLVLPTTTEANVKLYIDDGTGFEPSFLSQGFETVLESANGGEDRLQLDLFPLVKAQVETLFAEPFDMSSGDLTLNYTVGGEAESITLHTTDFAFPSAATAEEVVAAINNRATLVQARTSQSGQKLVITAVSDTNEDLQVTGGTANSVLAFPTDERATLYLYVNDRLMSKDGKTATILSDAGTFDFSGLGMGPWTLTVEVDGKSANVQTVTFDSSDFAVPSAATVAEVVEVINAQLAGVTASAAVNDTKVRLSSNITLSSRGKIRVTGGTANGVLGFSTSQVSGADRDYTLNRFLGQLEFVDPLSENANVTVGSLYTRAYLRCASPENYSITSGQTLKVKIDGAASQTVTFGSTSTYTAAQIATLINASLVGATARSREIGGLNYLEVATNSQDESTGSIEIDGTSTAAGLNFTADSEEVNQRPSRAYQVSGNVGPFDFLLHTSLIVVLDNNPTTKTYSVLMNYSGTLTGATSTTVFAASAFTTPFPSNHDLTDFYLVMTSGDNSTTGTVATVANVSADTWRYTFASSPSNLNRFAIGDHVTFGSLQNTENNGDFIVTGISTSGNGYIDVTNPAGIAESGSTGTMAIGARRQVSAYTGLTGAITVSSGMPVTPSIGDTFAVLPSTVKNTAAFMNNTKVTPLSTTGYIEACEQGTKIQISSQSNGSDGYVQVTGGLANDVLEFSTTQTRGLPAYQYYTGLLALANKTVYGDDVDPVSYPGIGAGGIQFDIQAPTVQEISFNLTITLAQGFSLNSLSDQIKSAITQYVNGLGVGNSVVLSEVIAVVMAITGVADMRIVSPTENISIVQSELPRTRASLITIG